MIESVLAHSRPKGNAVLGPEKPVTAVLQSKKTKTTK